MAVVRINVQIAQLLKFVVFTCYSRGLNTRLCIYIPKTITVVEWTFDSSNWTCYCSSSVQLLSRVRLCDPMSCSTPGLLVHHQLPEFTQTHVHRVGDAIQPSHPLLSPSPPAPNPSQYQGLFQWVNSSHEVAKVLQFQLQHQSFQRTPRTDLL